MQQQCFFWFVLPWGAMENHGDGEAWRNHKVCGNRFAMVEKRLEQKCQFTEFCVLKPPFTPPPTGIRCQAPFSHRYSFDGKSRSCRRIFFTCWDTPSPNNFPTFQACKDGVREYLKEKDCCNGFFPGNPYKFDPIKDRCEPKPSRDDWKARPVTYGRHPVFTYRYK